MTIIFGIRLDNRVSNAIEFQKVLTGYGCLIKTRLGLHDVADNKCAPNGLILLEILNLPDAEGFKNELLKIEGIELQTMKFE